MKRGFLVVLKNIPSLILTFTAPQSNHFHHSSPNSPKIPLSLIVDEHTRTNFPHSYLSYKSTTIHVLTRIQIPPQLLILLFQTTHSISLSLSQNNHFSYESSKSISSSLLSRSFHQHHPHNNHFPFPFIHISHQTHHHNLPTQLTQHQNT